MCFHVESGCFEDICLAILVTDLFLNPEPSTIASNSSSSVFARPYNWAFSRGRIVFIFLWLVGTNHKYSVLFLQQDYFDDFFALAFFAAIINSSYQGAIASLFKIASAISL